jgi:hypothetical protein
MEATGSFEKFVSNHHTTRGNPENHEFYRYRREKLKSVPGWVPVAVSFYDNHSDSIKGE